MNLYLITQIENDAYDTYDSAIVCAEGSLEAQYMYPDNNDYEWIEEDKIWKDDNGYGLDWTDPTNVKVKLIGKAKKGMPKGTVLSSFNAG